MKATTTLLPALAALLLAGCLELGDPVMPNRFAPAVLQLNMRIFDAGAFQLDGSLMPGRDSAGFQRVVDSPFIAAGGFIIEPRTLAANGLRTYQSVFAVPRGETAGPFEMIAPDVRGSGELPRVRWYGLERVGPDTLNVGPGEDIILRTDTVAAASDPSARTRQWFLEISGGGPSFRISSDGAPPPSLRIPAEWIPAAQDGRVHISLIYYQSAQIRSPGNTYIAQVLLDTRLNWVVRMGEGT